MSQTELIKEIVRTYEKHGWQWRRVLLRPESLVEFTPVSEPQTLAAIQIEEAGFDGLWFSRPSHEKREAWELRLIAETPYALFETFESDETEEQREEVRRELEARMREKTVKSEK